MSVLKIDGTLTAGSGCVSDGGFPAMSMSTPLSTGGGGCGGKGFQVASGILTMLLNSSLAFVQLSEPAGTAGAAVMKANFLYLKSDAPISMRRTQDDGSGGNIIVTDPGIQGIVMIEFSDINFLKKLELKGTSRIEYFVCGNQ
jgi:hypothetical protein